MTEAAGIQESSLQIWKIRGALLNGASGPVNGKELREALRSSFEAVTEGHRALTGEWRTPLSLFDDVAERAALSRGVPSKVVADVRVARGLVHEAAGLGDRTDAYEAQVDIARRESRGLRADALLAHIDACEELAGRMRGHLPALRNARAVFDAPPGPRAPDGDGELPAEEGSPKESRGEVSAGAREGRDATVILEPAKKDLLTMPPFFHKVWKDFRQTSNELMPRALEMAVDAVDYCVSAAGGASRQQAGSTEQQSGEKASRPDELTEAPASLHGQDEEDFREEKLSREEATVDEKSPKDSTAKQ